jgi:hypothetical protein
MLIVAMTTEPCDAAALLVSAAVECLAKPFDLDDLLACVAHAMCSRTPLYRRHACSA